MFKKYLLSIFMLGNLMFNFENLKTKNIKNENNSYIFVSDIGGTNSKFALAKINKKEKPELILKLRLDSKKIDNFADTINLIIKQIEKKINIKIDTISLASAGVISADRKTCKISNLDKTISVNEIIKTTKIKKVFLLNDFEAIGYGFQTLEKKDILEINKLKTINNKFVDKAYIGAGTGLGKGILVWNENKKLYIPKQSEGGHADFAAQDQQDLNLINFIKENKTKNCNVEWEDILSGRGLQYIYKFLLKNANQNKFTKEIESNSYDPALISKYKNEDVISKKTFELFSKYYARCAKCFALDTLSRGGIY
ncbi:ROK family protein, partial [Candidatus Dependentiae bacterium]|nr:ROK family protein [Candidatus Dependentiae bacterium]